MGPVHQNQPQIRLDIHIGMIQRCFYKHDCLHKHLGTGIHQNLRQLQRKFFNIVYQSNTVHALILINPLAPVVQKLDSTIHRINHYPVDKY